MFTRKSVREKEMGNLTVYMESVITQLKKEKKYPASRTYQATLNSFVQFSRGKETSLLIGRVFTPGRLKEYENWMRQRELGWNTVSTYMRTLLAVYNRLFPPGSLGHRPKLFAGVYTKVESQAKRALTKEQMQLLTGIALDCLKENKETQQAKYVPEKQSCYLGYFLLMFFFRGMPFIDLAYLRKSDLKEDTLTYHRHKTGKRMKVEIPPEAKGFLEKYRNKSPDSPYLFPILNARQTDDWKIRENYLGELRRFNARLNELAVRVFSGTVKLSSYTPRHTWATLMFYAGVSVGLISEALGHSSIRMTETYLKPFGNERVNKANKELIDSILNF